LYFTDTRAAQLELAARQHDIRTLREAGQFDEEPDDPDAAERALMNANLNFARARSLLDQGRYLAALAEDGRLLARLGRDYTAAAEFWRTHPGALAASLTGRAQNLVCASFSDTGWEWLKTEAVEPASGRAPAHDAIAALGVPGSSGEEGARPPFVRDPGGWQVTLTEVAPHWQPPRAEVTLGRQAGFAAARALAQPAGRWVRWLCWAWPSPDDPGREWQLPIGHRDERFALEPCLPAEGVVLIKNGAQWRMANAPSLTLEPQPQWIAELLGGKH
jgi:hypothetical protein